MFQYSSARLSLKVLVTFFLLFVGLGYIFGLIHIYNDVGFSYTGVTTHYRSQDVPPEFAFAKLIHLHHIHIFSLSMLFFLIGILFSFTSLSEVPKTIFMMMPFVGMLVDMSSFWLLTFSNPFFAWFAITFGGLMAFSFFLLIGRPLYEMWVLPIWKRKWKGNIPWYLH